MGLVLLCVFLSLPDNQVGYAYRYMRECSYNASITMCETVLSVYNPIRGRDACVAGSGGGTRYARLPPVIEIIPRRGISLR